MSKYFIIIDGDKQGPFQFDELKEQSIKPNTMVWRTGMDDWKEAKELQELDSILELIPPPISTSEPKDSIEPITEDDLDGDENELEVIDIHPSETEREFDPEKLLLHAISYKSLDELNSTKRVVNKIVKEKAFFIQLKYSRSAKGKIRFRILNGWKVAFKRELRPTIIFLICFHVIILIMKQGGIGSLFTAPIWFIIIYAIKVISSPKRIVFNKQGWFWDKIKPFNQVLYSSNENMSYAEFQINGNTHIKGIVLVADNAEGDEIMLNFLHNYCRQTGKKLMRKK